MVFTRYETILNSETSIFYFLEKKTIICGKIAFNDLKLSQKVFWYA